MANEFSNKWLTPDGQAYLAAAATGNKIIFVRALANTAYLDDNAAIVASSYSINDGTVTASQSAGTARIVAEFPNRTSAGVVVKTVAIVAKMESVYTTEKVILVQRDTNYGAYIPSVNDAISQRTQIFFTLGLTQNNSIVVTDGGYASKGDFDNLADRVVTAHALNDPDSGDDQDIYGQKSFQGDCSFSSITVSNELYADGGASVSDHLNVDCDILPSATGTYNIGSDTYKWDHIVTNKLWAYDTLTTENVMPLSSRSVLGTNGRVWYSAHIATANITTANVTSINVSGAASFNSQATFNDSVNMPDSGDNLLDVYCASSFSGDVTVSSPAQFEVEGNSYLNGTTTVNAVRRANSNSTIGTELAPFKSIYCTSADFGSLVAGEIEASGSILRNTASGTYNIGSATYKFSNVYATTFHGSLNGNATSANTAGSAGSAGSADTAAFATRATYANRLSYTSGSVNTAYLTTWSSNVISAAASITPNATSNTYTLGNSSYRWSTLYTKNIDCSSNATVGTLTFSSLASSSWYILAKRLYETWQTGSIVLLQIQLNTSSATSSTPWVRGTDISTITGAVIKRVGISSASSAGDLEWTSGNTNMFNGTWRLITDIFKSNNQYHFALAVRVDS